MIRSSTAGAGAFADVLGALNRACAIFVRDARVATSYRASFVLQVMGTPVSAAVMYFIALAAGNAALPGGGHYFDYLAINMAFYGFQSAALLSFGEAIRDSQLAGTLEMVLATPTSIPLLILSAGLWAFTYCGLQTVLFLGTSLAFGLDVTHTNVLTVLAFIGLTIACISPFGVFAASMTMVFKKSGPIEFVFNNSALLFGGIFLPIDKLPHVLQMVSWLLPISHALTGLRAGFRGLPLSALVPEVIWLCIASIVMIPCSLFVFARAVRIARCDGTLGSY